MRRQVRALIAVAVALVVCAGAVAALFLLPDGKAGETSSEPSSSAITLFSKEKKEIASIYVKNKLGEFTIVQKGNEVFEIPELSELPKNEYMFSSLLSGASEIKAESVISETPDNLEAFGLDKPDTVKISLKKGGDFTLLIGSKLPNKTNYYFMVEGDSRVYSSATNLEYFVVSNKLGFVSNAVVGDIDTSKDLDVVRLEFGGKVRAKPIIVEKNPEFSSADSTKPRYLVTSPKKVVADTGKVDGFASLLSSITAESVAAVYPTEEQLQNFGLKNPRATVDYEISGVKVSLILGDIKDDRYYVMRKGVPIVYLVPTGAVPWSEVGYEAIATNLVFYIYIGDLESVAIKGKGLDYRFDLAGEGSDLKVSYSGGELDVDNFRSWYTVLMTTRVEEVVKESYENKPELTLTFTYKGGKRKTVAEFTPVGTRRYFCSIDGQGDVLVLAEQIEKIVRDTNKLIKGEPISTLPGE